MNPLEAGFRIGATAFAAIGGGANLEQDRIQALLHPNDRARDHAPVIHVDPAQLYQESGLPQINWELHEPPLEPEANPPETPPLEPPPELPKDLAFLLLAEGTNADEIIQQVKQAGGHISQVFSQVLIGQVPETINLPPDQITATFRQPIEQGFIDTLSPQNQKVAQSWNILLTSPQPDPEIAAQVAEDLVDDALEVPEGAETKPEAPQITALAGTNPPDYHNTSTVMVGDIAVDLIFPQCNGTLEPCTESWKQEELNEVQAEIIESLLWWAEREPRANLVFFFSADFGQVTPSRYEPINHPSGFEQFWVADAMKAKGVAGITYFDQVRRHNNNLREALGADWAFTIFVVDSSQDDDNYFVDDRFAYAYLGGPFMVMTYGNNGYGISNMDAVAAHEEGHIKRAIDQYFKALKSCWLVAGYFGIPNLNSQYNPDGGPCPSNEHSIMRGQTYPYTIGAVDPYARGQIGWVDNYGPNLEPGKYGYAVPGPDGVLDFAGLYFFYPEVITSTNQLSATIKLAHFPKSLTDWSHVIHINEIEQVWAKDYTGSPISPTTLTIAPDGQQARGLFSLPERGQVELCVDGRFGGPYCQVVVSRPNPIFLPLIFRSDAPRTPVTPSPRPTLPPIIPTPSP